MAPFDRIERLERRTHRMFVAVLCLYAISLITVIVVGVVAVLNHNSLCTFTADLRRRQVVAQSILDDPTNRGKKTIDYFGLRIPRSVLQNQADSQMKTLDSLSGLHC